MSRSRFFNKVSKKRAATGFRGQQVDRLSWLCFIRCLLLSFFCIFFYVFSYLEGGIVPWLHPYRPLAEIRDRFRQKDLIFRDL